MPGGDNDPGQRGVSTETQGQEQKNVAAVGAMLAAVKINQTQPDEVTLVLKVPGEFKAAALELGNYVGWYFDGIAFVGPHGPDDED